jgi:uncharacterized protein (TIGR03546 family)
MFTDALKIESDAEVEAQSISPTLISHSIAYGIVFGLIPKDNLLAVGGIACLFFLPLHRVSTILTMVLVSLLPWFTDPIAHQIGESLLKPEALREFWLRSLSLPIVPWFGIHNTVVLGGLLIGLVTYPVNVFVCRTFLRFAQRHMMQKHIDEIFTLALNQKQIGELNIASPTVEQEPEPFQLHVAAYSPDDSVERDSVLQEEIEFLPFAEEESEDSIELEDQIRPAAFLRFDLAAHSAAVSNHESETSDAEAPDAPSASMTTTQPLVASVFPTANVRIDIPEEAAPSKLSVLESPLEFARAVETIRYEPSKQFKEGSMVRDTVIEVLRFRSNDSTLDHGNSTPSIPSLVTSFDSNKEIMPEQLIANNETPATAKPKSPAILNRENRGGASSNEQDSATPISGSASTSTFHPAEESLRFLLWHLNSANRENRE